MDLLYIYIYIYILRYYINAGVTFFLKAGVPLDTS